MSYVAQTRLKVGHDEAADTPTYREPGDVVPEAETWDWRTQRAYERDGRMRFVPDASSDGARQPAKSRSKG